MVITTDITEVTRIIQAGRVAAFPTGTSYGLAADALQGHALQRVRNLKGRPSDKTFTVFIAPSLWDTYLVLTAREKESMPKLNGQAITLLVSPTAALAHLAQGGRVGLRMIDHPLMEALAEQAQVPLTATSANKAGQPPCFTPADISTTFPGKLDETTYDLSLGAVLDGGVLPPSEPSTIISLTDSGVTIHRPGRLTADEVEKILA
ncbi:MAG: L-threonylcarbamoyladenylate synthase [Candidatus Andersenbacteria bacterium]